MAEREAIYKLKFLVDRGGQQESIRAIDTLANSFADVDKNAQAVSKSAQTAISKLTAFGQGRNALGATAEAAKQVVINSDAMGTALDKGIAKLRTTAEEAKDAEVSVEALGDTMGKTAKEISKAAQSADGLGGRLDQADERFDVISRRVGSLGDTQSNLGAASSLANTAGLGSVGKGIGVAGELAALGEEIPRLKAALSALPDAFKFAASELGAKGVGLIGALGALAVVAALAAKSQEDNRQKAEAAIEGLREYFTALQSGTRATVETQIAAYQAELDGLKKLQKAQTDQANTANETFTQIESVTDEIGKGFLGFNYGAEGAIKLGKEVGVFGQEAKVAEDAVSSTSAEILALEAKITALGEASNDTQLIFNEQIAQIEAAKNTALSFYQEQFQLELKSQELIRSGTSEQVKERLGAIEIERLALNALLGELNSISEPTEEITAAILQYENQTVSLQNETNALTYSVLPLIEAREKEAALAETSAQALEAVQSRIKDALKFNEEATRERIAQLKEQAQSELEFTRFIKSASAESVQSRVEALQEEAAALRSILPELERLAPTSADAAQEFANTTDRLSEIDDQLKKIGSQGVIAAIQREQEQLTEEIEKIEAARDEKIAQIREQAAQKEIDLFQDLQRDLADAIAEAQEERADAQRDYIEESAEIEQDLARKRLDIQKKFGRSLEQAIDDRDALAANQAKQARDDDLEDAEDAAQEQRQTLQEEYQRQLETIDRELAKQQQTLQAKYAQQLNDLRVQTANSISLEQQKAQQEINTRQQAYQQELALLQSFAQNGVTTISAFAQGGASSLVQFSSQAQTILAGFVSQANSIMSGLISGGGSSPTPPPPSPIGGPQQPFAGGGVNFNIAGFTIPQIQAQIYDVLSGLIN